MLFALTIHPLIEKLKCELNSWYLDDGTLCDHPEIVLEDFKLLIIEAKKLGLQINSAKCELYFCSDIDNNIVSKFDDICPGIRVMNKENLTLLGVPIFEEGFAAVAENIFNKLKIMFGRLKQLNSHTSYCLLKTCFGIPKLTYLIRTTPAWKFKNFIATFDNEIKNTLESILNIHLTDQQWTQASLSIAFGGIGIRKPEDICLPAFLSSTFGVEGLVSRIIHFQDKTFISNMEEALNQWNVINELSIPDIKIYQRN